jgi:hypothetical protein
MTDKLDIGLLHRCYSLSARDPLEAIIWKPGGAQEAHGKARSPVIRGSLIPRLFG